MWIDADSAPRDVKEIVLRAAKRLKLAVCLVANQPIFIPSDNPLVTRIVVRSGANEADKYIIEHAEKGDLVITADVPLAAELVARDVRAIDPRGEEYHASTIPGRLATRNLLDAARGAGMLIPGPNPYSDRDRREFAQSLDRLLTKSLKSINPKLGENLPRRTAE